jgi:hypothetical protein
MGAKPQLCNNFKNSTSVAYEKGKKNLDHTEKVYEKGLINDYH